MTEPMDANPDIAYAWLLSMAGPSCCARAWLQHLAVIDTGTGDQRISSEDRSLVVARCGA